MLIDDLPTPSILIERHRLQDNLDRMQARATANGVALRPHIKTHKSLALAGHQRGLGAQGLTMAKPGEAEVFVEGGFDDIRLAYTVVGEDKYRRLLSLMDRARISFCVDTLEGASRVSAFFAAHDRRIEVLMEIDVGYGRCGITWDDPDLTDLAHQIAALPGLKLVGILTHAGHSYHGPHEGESKEEALQRVMREERDRMLAVAVRMQKAGVPNAEPGSLEISIGSTPSMTYFENRTLDGFSITEIRPGNYVFYDTMQVSIGSATLPQCALTVLTTVVSKHRDHRGQEKLFFDAGKKVFTSDPAPLVGNYGTILYNPAEMVPHPHLHLTGFSEEHGWVKVHGGATLSVGDRVRVVPNHACVTVNTQDKVYLVDGDEVIHEWLVDARGRVQ